MKVFKDLLFTFSSAFTSVGIIRPPHCIIFSYKNDFMFHFANIHFYEGIIKKIYIFMRE
jgi:hypothetical protein